MALDQDEGAPSRSQSESSDDSDSQDSEDMPISTADSKGNAPAVKAKDDKVKKAANKDPNRIKRKKARRACENCQRAHLTCSDKRPCERCGDKKICKDGKRKKAKYLADAPDEDLTPGQDQIKDSHFANFPGDWHGGQPFSRSSFPGPGVGGLYASQQPGYPLFVTQGQQNLPFQPYTSQQIPPAQAYTAGPHQQPILPDFRGVPQQNMQTFSDPSQSVSIADFCPNPNLEDHHSFANQYGRDEFIYMTQLTSCVAGTPPSESTGTLNRSDDANVVPGLNTPGYGSAVQPYQYRQDPGMVTSRPDLGEEVDPFAWNGHDHDSLDGLVKQEDPAGYSIYNDPSSSCSGSSPQGMTAGVDESPSVKSMYTNINPSRQAQLGETLRPMTSSQQQSNSKASQSTNTSTATISSVSPIQPSIKTHSSISNRRHRNPSTIYNAVTEPYSYTRAFHDLMALIRKRFTPSKTARIAKALASIRPSFISSLTKLDDNDRVFMEKCLQRTLLEYDDFLSATGTPTIICRRTGEVVAVGEGFSILTGWRKAVLLGKEPNLNVNNGGDVSGPQGTGLTSSRGGNIPLVADGSRLGPLEESRQKPVSIVDLLDDESACDFFDDYSHLAFGDSRGSVVTPCKLLKYKAAKDADLDETMDREAGSRLKRQNDTARSGKDGAAGVAQIGDHEGKVECMLCWSVKRDVFDIPMLFVMNVLPCI